MMKSLSKVYQYLSFICLLIQFLFSIYFYNQSGVFFEEGVLILFQSLIGLLVVTDEGKELGIVEDIFPTGANQVMEVKMEKKNVLIPYIKECILDVDLENQKIVVHLLKGLLDL